MKVKICKILLVILIIFLLFLCGVEIFNTINKDNVNNKNIVRKKIDDKEITNDDIISYLNYVPFASNVYDYPKNIDAYYGSVETTSTVDKDILYANIYDFSKKTNKRESNSIHDKSDFKSCVSISEFDNNIKNLYDSSIIVDKFSYKSGTVYKTNSLYCLFKKNKENKIYKYSNYLSSNYENGDYVIREKVGFFVINKGKLNIYKSTSREEIIKELDYNKNSFHDDANNYISSNINDFYTFKHIFRKNYEGLLYWYSTEIE